MGFLQRFFHSVFRDERVTTAKSSFEQLSDEELDAHLEVDRYGDFVLTDAVRPAFDLAIVPSAGFRHDVYRDEENRVDVPVLMAAASREKVFQLFLDMLDPLGEVVDVVLETSHHRRDGRGHQDLYREHIDLPVLKSILYDYEDLLLNDGCTGIAVLNPQIPREVQFDEHKLIIAYGHDLSMFEECMADSKVPCREKMKFITEAEHVHSSSEEYFEQLLELKMRLGMDAESDDLLFS